MTVHILYSTRYTWKFTKTRALKRHKYVRNHKTRNGYIIINSIIFSKKQHWPNSISCIVKFEIISSANKTYVVYIVKYLTKLHQGIVDADSSPTLLRTSMCSGVFLTIFILFSSYLHIFGAK